MIYTKIQKYKKQLIFPAILVGAFLIRLCFLIKSDNFHGIAAGKIIDAMQLLKHLSDIRFWIVPAHGPVHLYLIAAVLKICKDPFFYPQFVSFIMSLAIFIPFYNYVKQGFGKEVALCSIFILAFYPLHIIYSVLSTAETTFNFLLFTGLFFFLKSIYCNYKTSYVIISALTIGLASMCRFEGIVFVFILPFLTLKNDIKKSILFFIVSGLLPAAWVCFNFIFYADPLYFLHSSDIVSKKEYYILDEIGRWPTLSERISYIPRELSNSLNLFVTWLGFIGVSIFGYKKKYKNYAIFFLILLLIFTLKIIKTELAMEERYTIIIGILLTPFSALLFLRIFSKIRSLRLKKVIFCCITFYFMFSSAYVVCVGMPQSPYVIKRISSFLQQNVQSHENVFVECDDENIREPIKLYSCLDTGQFVDHYPFPSPFKISALIAQRETLNLKYIVLVSKKRLANLTPLVEEKEYVIYKLPSKIID